jgi:hypothetical protein
VRWAAFGALACSASSCLVVQDLGDDRARGAGGSAAAAAGDAEPLSSGDFSCVGHVVFEPPAFHSIGTLLRVGLWGHFGDESTEFVASPAVPDATVRVCAAGDLECAAPLSTQTTGPDGRVALSLTLEPPRGFFGYLEIYKSSAPIENLRFFVPPIRAMRNDTAAFALPRAEANLAYQAIGESVDPKSALGAIAVDVVDCLGHHADRMVVELDGQAPPTRTVYFDGVTPSAARVSTDTRGLAFVALVGSGKRVLRARTGGREVAAVELGVRGGAITTLTLPPTPSWPW